MFKVKGKVIEIMSEQKGTSARGEWKKRDFVLETNDPQYPKKICFTLFNNTLNVGIGAEIEVSFSLESREYNGKWFTNVNAFKVELNGVEPIKTQHQTQGATQEEIKQHEAKVENQAYYQDNEWDLPF